MNFKFISKICSVFAKQPSLQITIRELSKQAKLSYNATHRTVQHMLKEELLTQQKYGNVCVVSIKKTAKMVSLLAYAAYEESKDFKNKIEYQETILPKGILSILGEKKELIAISEVRNTDTIHLQNKELKLITIQELLAALSNGKIKLKELKILQGAEWLFEKMISTT